MFMMPGSRASRLSSNLTPWNRYAWFKTMRPYTQWWVLNAYLAGGTLTKNDIDIAETCLAQPIFQAGLESKIVALYPFLGDVNAATCPLHDLRGRGPAANSGSTGFTNSTLGTSALGLVTTNIADTQFLNTNLTPNQVAGVVAGSTAIPAGIFVYHRATTFSTTSPDVAGCYSNNQSSTARFSIDNRSNKEAFNWCNSTNAATSATAAGNNDYYGECSASNLRTLYKNGASLATNTTTDATPGSSLPIIWGGVRLVSSSVVTDLGTQSVGGRQGVCGLTLGTLGSTGASTLHTILSNFCTAAGR